jgi:hypothetical protein
MGLGLSGAFGAAGAMAGLREVQDRDIEAQLRADAAKQREFQNQIALRQAAEMEAGGAFERRPIALKPIPQSGMIGSGGQKATLGTDPYTGETLYELPEYVTPTKPEATTDYQDFLSRWASGRGKTVATLTAQDEVAARKAWGQADDRPIQPIVLQGPTGPLVVDRGSGTGRPVTDASGQPIGPTPSQAVRTRMGEEEAGLDRINEIRGLYDSNYVGPAMGRWNQLRQNIPDLPGQFDDIPEPLAKFMASAAGLKNDMIRLITGAAVGVQEAKRIEREIPNITDRPEVFTAKLAQTEKNRMSLMARIGAATGMGQGPTGQTSGARPYTGEVRQTTDGRTIGNLNGQVVELVKSGAGWVIK